MGLFNNFLIVRETNRVQTVIKCVPVAATFRLLNGMFLFFSPHELEGVNTSPKFTTIEARHQLCNVSNALGTERLVKELHKLLLGVVYAFMLKVVVP